MTTQAAVRFAAWSSLALLGLSACAQAETGGGDLEAWGGEGGEWTSTPIGSVDNTSGSASGMGAGNTGGSGNGSDTGGGCGQDEHFCGGLCAGNTPPTGCLQSDSCEPCTAPEHATPTCTAEGTCDFACDDDYHLVDGQCRCALECCTSLDCSGGNICSGGACVPPPCYPLECLGTCFLSLQCGGICIGTTCTCFPCQ